VTTPRDVIVMFFLAWIGAYAIGLLCDLEDSGKFGIRETVSRAPLYLVRRFGVITFWVWLLGLLAILGFTFPPILDTPIGQLTLGMILGAGWRLAFAAYAIRLSFKGNDRNYPKWGRWGFVALLVYVGAYLALFGLNG